MHVCECVRESVCMCVSVRVCVHEREKAKGKTQSPHTLK